MTPMKQHLTAWLMTALVSAMPAGAVEPVADKPFMQARQVVPSIYYVQGLSEMGSSANQNFISNAGFVVTPAGVVVVDALGSPELAKRLLAQIRNCNTMLGMKWFEDEELNVAAYLNQSYYHFDK